MTVAKIAISLPEKTLARAKAAVRDGEAPSLSAFIASAIEQKGRAGDLRKLLDEMLDESGGPTTAAERREAARELGLVPKKKRASRKRRAGSR